MTFCLALAQPQISLVIADTRVNLIADGSPNHHDGPNDLTISVGIPKQEMFLPFRMRKIGKVGLGWAAIAGQFNMGKEVLALIANQGIDNFVEIQNILKQNYPRLRSKLEAETGLPGSRFDETIVIGAPFGHQPTWVVSCDPEQVATSADTGNYVASWPKEITSNIRISAEKEFVKDVESGLATGSFTQIARAAIMLVDIAAKHSDKVGSMCQIGASIKTSETSTQSIYLQGVSHDLLALQDVQLLCLIEKNA